MTPLHFAANKYNLELAIVLLDNGAEINVKNKWVSFEVIIKLLYI